MSNDIEWAMFTKRTNNPKLSWLRKQLNEKGIPNRIHGRSFYAPILEVPENQLGEAWKILPLEIDDLPDNDPMFK